MDKAQMPADWAIERAREITGTQLWTNPAGRHHAPIETFARYIASKEQPPVDPILAEARKLADEYWPGEGFIDGDHDESVWMDRILTALKRGLALAKGATDE